VWLAGGCALALLTGGAASVSPASAVPTHSALAATRHVSTKTLLSELKVGSTYHAGYVRAKFVLWTIHPDGCNTRYQVLIRDAIVKPHVGPGCYLTHGEWRSPYDDHTFTNPTKLQIDHVVPLAVAWGAGAWEWDPTSREAFANDLGTRYDLIAVSGQTNESKGDQGPDRWLPPHHTFDCRYMADYTAVLWRWQLTVDSTQKAFLTAHLRRCGWPRIATPRRPAIHRLPAGGGGGRQVASGVRISAINFDSPGPDTGGNASRNDEWVQITNTANKTASLADWTLHDASSHIFVFPAVSLKPHHEMKVHTGSGSDTAANLYWGSSGYIWNNSGDTATLTGPTGKKIDACTYTASQDPKATC
jgi:Lamin Tail Domain/Protein of unknown function (DUF1524)